MFYTRILFNSWRKKARLNALNPIIIPTVDESKWKIAIRVLRYKYEEYPLRKLGGIAACGFVICVIGFTTQNFFIHYRWQTSDAVQLALLTFDQQKQLLEYLGTPIKIGWIHPLDRITDDRFHAEIPISGIYLDGCITIDAYKRNDAWELVDMKFKFLDEAGGVIQLVKNKY